MRRRGAPGRDTWWEQAVACADGEHPVDQRQDTATAEHLHTHRHRVAG